MANATVGYSNIVDRNGVTLTQGTGDFTNSLPLANVRHAHVAKVARTSGSNAVIKLDAGEDVTAAQAALIGITTTTNFTYRLRADPDGGSFGNGNTLDTTSFDQDVVTDQVLNDFGQDITARYWQWDLSDSGQFDIGRLVLAPTLKMSINITYPLESRVIDRTLTQITEGGQILTYQRPQAREHSFNYGTGITRADAYDDLLRTLDRLAGQHSDILFVIDKNDPSWGVSQMIWGRLQELSALTHSGFNQYEKSYTIREVL